MSKKQPSRGRARSREVGDLICGALHGMYVENPGPCRKMAAKEGVPVESIVAMMITTALGEGGHLAPDDGPSEDGAIPRGTPNPHHQLPPIPAIPSELVMPIRVLARVASSFHKIVRETPGFDQATMPEGEMKDLIVGCEAILTQWMDHIGVTAEDLWDSDGD